MVKLGPSRSISRRSIRAVISGREDLVCDVRWPLQASDSIRGIGRRRVLLERVDPGGNEDHLVAAKSGRRFEGQREMSAVRRIERATENEYRAGARFAIGSDANAIGLRALRWRYFEVTERLAEGEECGFCLSCKGLKLLEEGGALE